MSYTTTVHPPPRGHLEFSRNCGATQEQRDEIFDFLLLKAPQSSTTRQFALGGFTGHCPERTGWTVAVVKKLWHGWGRETWFTTELQFRRTKDGPMLATLGTSHLHRNLRETRRTPGQRHHFERPSGSDLERVTYRVSTALILHNRSLQLAGHQKRR